MSTTNSSDSTRSVAGGLTCAALVLAVVGLAGSLYLSIGMALKACPLCFYQRTFMMSIVAVLAMGLGRRTSGIALLALPLAAAGLGVACFHVFLEMTGKLECPGGIFGLGTAPQQSLSLFAVLFALLFLDSLRTCRPGRWIAITGGVVLGATLAVGSSVSNPPIPAPPTVRYEKSPDICRPPFSGGS